MRPSIQGHTTGPASQPLIRVRFYSIPADHPAPWTFAIGNVDGLPLHILRVGRADHQDAHLGPVPCFVICRVNLGSTDDLWFVAHFNFFWGTTPFHKDLGAKGPAALSTGEPGVQVTVYFAPGDLPTPGALGEAHISTLACHIRFHGGTAQGDPHFQAIQALRLRTFDGDAFADGNGFRHGIRFPYGVSIPARPRPGAVPGCGG